MKKTASVKIPTGYYIVIPHNGFADVDQIIAGRSTKIPIPVRRKLNNYLLEYGEFTDKNQFQDPARDFRYWTMDGKERVIVEDK